MWKPLFLFFLFRNSIVHIYTMIPLRLEFITVYLLGNSKLKKATFSSELDKIMKNIFKSTTYIHFLVNSTTILWNNCYPYLLIKGNWGLSSLIANLYQGQILCIPYIQCISFNSHDKFMTIIISLLLMRRWRQGVAKIKKKTNKLENISAMIQVQAACPRVPLENNCVIAYREDGRRQWEHRKWIYCGV